MRIAISGSSGLIGNALKGSLTADEHEVVTLVRRAAGPGEIGWNPDTGTLDAAALEGFDAIVNLNGAPIAGRRWSAAYKKVLLASRTNATRTLAETIKRLDDPPRVFVSASAIDYYGLGRGSDVLDEDEPAGTDFLARLVDYWEEAASPAVHAGVAVVYPRFGNVISARGGPLAAMLPRFRLGLGGPIAGGWHYWSAVSVVDATRALRFLIDTLGCTGSYNVTAPEPVTQGEFVRTLADELHRPALLPVPALALQIRYGELVEYIVASRRVLPRRLVEAGFEFDHPDTRSIIKAALRNPMTAKTE
ncbi:MAG TPA: TIGR01777 family oxidoreductase [Jiangellaceae bacterium]